ncbi:GAF domain-containing sensor histidine kinase [Allocoleopsis franciscana]|uniref:histidine kinase n=1 Tax=Allocoleopsis franciscana PCC 7113 TaxID=1173027 RepID=K9WJF9_9CYAN|nr:GAF domain-containing sensor histidine kinase [Allocoleopsis franciscana]AFZ20540.1 histidine kinase,GAF domain-containing protein [Allocoleopsis franciscana PCC 7113]
MTNPEPRIFCRLDGLTPAAREQKRLTALIELGLLETETVTVFEEAAQTAARLIDAPIGILGVMGQNDLHIKAAVGLSRVGLMNQLAKSRLLPRSESFCTYVVDSHQVLAIYDTAIHPIFASSLLVGHYGIRAYLGAPLLTADGLCLGTLAVMDWEPRSFSAKEIELLAITARWSLSEFERNRFLQQEYSSSIQKIPLSSTISQYRGGWGGESTTDRQDVSQDFSAGLNSGNSIKLQLLAQLTQELRTPLTSVMGMASVLTRQVYGPLTSKQKEYLEIIHRSGQQLISLVDEIVDLKILDDGSEQLQLTSVDIEMLCQQAINSLLEIAQRQQLEIRLSVEPGNRIGLLDKDKVRQILYYLIYSVIQSAEAGSEVRLHASRKTDTINMAVWVSHPWLGDGLPQFGEGVVESYLPSSAIAAVSTALETSPDNSEMESSELIAMCYLSPTAPVLSSALLPVPLSLNSKPNKTPEKPESRESLGLLLSSHLAELHGGEISVQGSTEAGYRYVVTLPLFESEKERL